MVIKLLSNPSFLNLKAVYEFYFEDKNGKPYKRKGESTFGELTVSSDIHLLSSDDFQKVMKENQEVQFTISFTVVGEIKKSSNTNGIRKDFKYSLPKLLSTFPCIRDSKEYYFKGKKWQYHLEVKENNDLWIYFQLLEIYSKNYFDAKFKIKANDTCLGEVSCRFGPSSLCSKAIEIKSGQELVSFFDQTDDDFEVEVVPQF
uniref:Uncharacterized protein n=1 Tax=Panagrolaimus davidi TaxID=227884 RepID=A0A914PW84_9BILA